MSITREGPNGMAPHPGWKPTAKAPTAHPSLGLLVALVVDACSVGGRVSFYLDPALVALPYYLEGSPECKNFPRKPLQIGCVNRGGGVITSKNKTNKNMILVVCNRLEGGFEFFSTFFFANYETTEPEE